MNKKQVILGFLVIMWMAIVFYFSAQEAEKSSKTSGNAIRVIVDTLPNTKKLKTNEKEKIVKKMQPIIRKLAHYSIYTIGGIIIYAFINTLKIKYKIIFSTIIGLIYSISDEMHQFFVSGRSAEIRDICIDTTGVLTGVIIIYCIIYLIERRKKYV